MVRSIEEDPEFDKKQASSKIRAWVEAQPETIDAKARIIVEHFHENVINKGKVGGQARAMVVTSSIIRAIEINRIFLSEQDRTMLDPILDTAVERFKELDDDGKIDCKSAIKGYNRIYPFLAAVIPHSSKYWEKMYIYLHLLAAKLPRIPREDWTEGLLDAIDFDQYRSIKQAEAQFQMENEDTGIDPVPVGGGGSTSDPDFDKLSNMLEEFNATWGGIEWEYPEEAIEQIRLLPERLAANENFSNAVRRSDEQNAEIESNNALFQIVVELLSEKTEFARNYLDNPQFQAFVNQRVFNQAYNQIAR